MHAGRRFLLGLTASGLCAPAIVRASALMSARSINTAALKAPAFCFAQRLYTHGTMDLINLRLNENLGFAAVAKDLNRRGFEAINGTPWDARAVENVVKLNRAIRQAAKAASA